MHFSLALLLFGCPLELHPKPSGEVETGECLGTPGESARLAEAPEEAPEVIFLVEDGQLVLDYLAMEANCCPSPRVEVETGPHSVSVDLQDVSFDDPCDCTCLTDFVVRVSDLEPGAWTVSAHFNGVLQATEVVDL